MQYLNRRRRKILEAQAKDMEALRAEHEDLDTLKRNKTIKELIAEKLKASDLSLDDRVELTDCLLILKAD